MRADKRVLSVMLTHQCTAACDDCGTFSTPQRKEFISREAASKKIAEAAELQFAVVVFTGGEVTLRWKDLLALIRECNKIHGLPTRVVTNAHWAKTPERAAQKVRQLIDAGLSEINYSTGDEHQKYVPVENVLMAAAASSQAGLTTCIMVEVREGNVSTGRRLREHPLLISLPEEQIQRIGFLESPWMPMDPAKLFDYPGDRLTNSENVHTRRGCDSMMSTYTVQANEQVGACCGLGLQTIPELNVGQISEPLGVLIERSENDLVKRAIRFVGPAAMLHWAKQRDPSIDWENRYAHHCHACKRVYDDAKVHSAIRANIDDFASYVKQAEHFDQKVLRGWFVNRNVPMAAPDESTVSPSSLAGVQVAG